MSSTDSDIEQFVAILPKLLNEHVTQEQSLDDPSRLSQLRRALEQSGVSDLALETLEMPNALHWLVETLSRVAHASPSLAFVLAARYVAQRAVRRGDGVETEVTAGISATLFEGEAASPHGEVTVADLFTPATVVLVDPLEQRAISVDRDALEIGPLVARTGLSDARLRQVRVGEAKFAALDQSTTTGLLHEWTVLMAAVSLGIAEAALHAAQTYAAERRQFGSSLISFPALRAMLAEMHLRVATVQSLLTRALEAEPDGAEAAELWSAAGTTAVEVALDAIQLHGGYGYIDEYPVANLLRDAVSMRARGGSRRSALVATATVRLGALT